MRYAAQTTVSSDKSKAEIEKLLIRYGADQFMAGHKKGLAIIGFTMNGKVIRFNLPLPDPKEERFRFTATRRLELTESAQYNKWEQATRQSWRALALVVKAKLEAVESGITTFEDEFMAHIVLPDGRTAGEWLKPQIEQAYETKKMPKLLEGF